MKYSLVVIALLGLVSAEQTITGMSVFAEPKQNGTASLAGQKQFGNYQDGSGSDDSESDMMESDDSSSDAQQESATESSVDSESDVNYLELDDDQKLNYDVDMDASNDTNDDDTTEDHNDASISDASSHDSV